MDRLRQIAAQRFFGRLIIRECRNDEKEGVWVDFFFFFILDPSCQGEQGFCPYIFLIRIVTPLVYDGYFLSGKANLIVMRR